MPKNDRISSLLLLAFCAFFYYQTYSIDTSEMVKINSAFYPRLVLGLIALLSVIMLIRSLLSAPSIKEQKEKETSVGNERKWVVGLIFVLFSLSIFFIEIIGFILSSFLLMAGMYFMILREKRPIKKHLFALGGLLVTTVLLTLFFEQYLDVYLPRGVFEDI